MDGSSNKKEEEGRSPAAEQGASPLSKKGKKKKLKGAMSFDEEELRALSQNIGAATANFAMEASERSKRTLSPKRRKRDATIVTEENGDEEGGQDESKPTESIEGTDTEAAFEALEKPEAVDAKAERDSEEKLKRVALIKQRQALFDNLERSEEISKDEIKEGEKMMKELQARVDKKRAEKPSPQQTGKTEKKAQKTDSRTAVAKKTGTPKPPPRRKRSSSLRDLRPKRSISQRELVPPKRQSSLTDLTSKSKEATTSNAESSCEMPTTALGPVTSQTSQKTSSSGSEKSTTSSSMKSPVEAVSSSHEISARRASSVPARSPVRPKQPPKCHYKVVYVRISLVGKTIDASITENLVLIFIPLGSPLFYHFVVGDQILDIDGLVPKNLAEFLELVDSATGEITLAVVRAWNVRPPTPKRMSHVWTVKKRSYLIVELPLLENMRAGFEFICHNNRLYFSKLDPQTMGAFAFLTVDRIVDVDSIQIPNHIDVVALKNRIRAVQERDGFCTFLVERPSSLHHLSNPSCVAMKSPTDDVLMSDDAVEIGCREAFKFLQVKDRNTRSPSVYGALPVTITQETLALQTAEENELSTKDNSKAFALTPRRRKRRKRKLKLGRNKEQSIPSDVKMGTTLSRTSDSSLRKLVTKFISRMR